MRRHAGIKSRRPEVRRQEPVPASGWWRGWKPGPRGVAARPEARRTLFLRREAALCASASMALGGLVLVGWLAGVPALARVAPGFIPMAPITALFFVAHGGALLVLIRRSPSRLARALAGVGAVAVIAACLVILPRSLVGVATDVERFLVPSVGRSGAFMAGRMSPITAISFELTGVALLLLGGAGRTTRRVRVAAVLGTGVTSVGMTILIGYGYGTPVLYGGTLVPVALPTAVAFAILGLGLVLAAGPEVWPARAFVGPSLRARLNRAFLPASTAVILAYAWLDTVLPPRVSNPAVTSFIVTVLALVAVGHVTLRLARRIGGAIDRIASEKAQAQEALHESEQKYRSIFEHAVAGMYQTTLGGQYLAANPTLARTLGYESPEEMMRLAPDLEHGFYVDQARRAEFRRRVEEQGTVSEFESQVYRKDGSIAWVSENARAIRDAEGTLIGFEGTTVDISERKRAEELLRYRLDIEQLVAGISGHFINVASAELDAAITGVLGALGTFAGVDRSSVFQLSWDGTTCSNTHEWCAPGIAPERDMLQSLATDAWPWLMARLKLSETVHVPRVADLPPEATEERKLFEAGQIRSLVAVPLLHGRSLLGFLGLDSVRRERTWSEEDIALLGMVGDILVNAMQRSSAEKTLRESEERHRNLVDNLAEGVAIVDPEEHFVFSNPANDLIFGVPTGTLIGRSVMEFLPVKGLADTREQTERRKRRETSTYELDIVRPDGEKRSVLVTANPQLDQEGRFVATFGIVRDVTERRRLEAQIAHSRKLEAVAALAAGVAHNLNNILQAVVGTAGLMRHRGGDREAVEHDATAIEGQVRRAATLAHQLILFTRQEVTRREAMDLNRLVARVSAQVRDQAPPAITLVARTSAEPLPVEADAAQLEQVLLNLAVNAWEAMPDGGEITFSTGSDADGSVWLAVRDTGRGIPADIRDRIFEPFFSTKHASKGTGLGLAVVHGVVAAHGGRIEIDSEVGKGTSLRIVLPRTSSGEFAAVAEPARAAPETTGGRGERILMVEDEEAARDTLCEILTTLGYVVVAVASGEEAGTLPEKPAFDVLLTDLMLPGVPGGDLARGLVDRWPALKVILMSGHTQDEAVRRGVGQGTIRFLQKPFDMDTLAREIRAALDEDRNDA